VLLAAKIWQLYVRHIKEATATIAAALIVLIQRVNGADAETHMEEFRERI